MSISLNEQHSTRTGVAIFACALLVLVLMNALAKSLVLQVHPIQVAN